jgi:hypothetical protein
MHSSNSLSQFTDSGALTTSNPNINCKLFFLHTVTTSGDGIGYYIVVFALFALLLRSLPGFGQPRREAKKCVAQ